MTEDQALTCPGKRHAIDAATCKMRQRVKFELCAGCAHRGWQEQADRDRPMSLVESVNPGDVRRQPDPQQTSVYRGRMRMFTPEEVNLKPKRPLPVKARGPVQGILKKVYDFF